MFSRKWNALALGVAMFAAGFGVRGFVGGEVAYAQAATRVFEMRTYDWPRPASSRRCSSRFRDHTPRLFEKHGMQNIGYRVPADPPNSENTLTYIIAHKDSRGCEGELGGVWRRSGLAEGAQESMAGRGQPDHEGRVACS